MCLFNSIEVGAPFHFVRETLGGRKRFASTCSCRAPNMRRAPLAGYLFFSFSDTARSPFFVQRFGYTKH
jgi:hypothetical protein